MIYKLHIVTKNIGVSRNIEFYTNKLKCAINE